MSLLPFNFIVIAGLYMLVFGIFTLFFPPKFNNVYYGVITKWTSLNLDSWKDGQKIFAYSYLCIGLLFLTLGFFKVQLTAHGFIFVLLIIVLHKFSIFLVDKKLAAKYGDKV